MKTLIKKAVKWICDLIKEEITEPFRNLEKKIDSQGEELKRLQTRVSQAHQYDAAARECDLASLDDQICQQIEKCRLRGYTTAEDRRRVGRMHRAYHARGGNDGETEEYARFLQLKSEEAFHRNADCVNEDYF